MSARPCLTVLTTANTWYRIFTTPAGSGELEIYVNNGMWLTTVDDESDTAPTFNPSTQTTGARLHWMPTGTRIRITGNPACIYAHCGTANAQVTVYADF